MKGVSFLDKRLQIRQQKKHRHRGLKIFSIVAGLIVLMAVCGIFFFPQINNTIRNVTGNDTPADSAVKARIVSGITAQKTGNPATDAVLQRAADTIKETKMSTIMKAAQDQDQGQGHVLGSGEEDAVLCGFKKGNCAVKGDCGGV